MATDVRVYTGARGIGKSCTSSSRSRLCRQTALNLNPKP